MRARIAREAGTNDSLEGQQRWLPIDDRIGRCAQLAEFGGNIRGWSIRKQAADRQSQHSRYAPLGRHGHASTGRDHRIGSRRKIDRVSAKHHQVMAVVCHSRCNGAAPRTPILQYAKHRCG